MFFIGIDVSKAKLDCCLLLDVTNYKRRAKVIANTPKGMSGLLAWCAKQQVPVHQVHAVLEGTGIYHEQAALALADAGAVVSIVNPAQVKDFGRSLGVRTKTDGVDSFVLARYGALLNPRPWTPPAHEARILQALLSRREAVAQDLQRERNRLEKADATDTPPLIRQSISGSIDFLEKQLAKLQQDIDGHINKHSNLKEDRDLLTSTCARRVFRRSGRKSATICCQSCTATLSSLPNSWLPISAWCRWSGNPALRSMVVRACPKLAPPASVLSYTWPPLSQPSITRTSRHFTSVCRIAAKPRCPHSVQPCVN